MSKLVTGFIRSTHGVEGRVKIESASGEINHLMNLKEVTVRKQGIDSFEASFVVQSISGHERCLLLKLEGIDSPEQAKKLVGSEILVPRDKACPLEKGEFYVSDLCQCNLVCDGVVMGRIQDVIEGGAGDLLEVSLTEDVLQELAGPKIRMVPMKDQFIGSIDIKKGFVELKHRWILG